MLSNNLSFLIINSSVKVFNVISRHCNFAVLPDCGFHFFINLNLCKLRLDTIVRSCRLEYSTGVST